MRARVEIANREESYTRATNFVHSLYHPLGRY